jgi:uncharacterized protein (TIGR00299 family) protein
MKLAIIECFAGISGDMTLGALLDWGVPLDYLKNEIKKLSLSDYSIECKMEKRHHLAGTKVTITYDVTKQPNRNYQTIKTLIENSMLKQSVKEKSLSAFKLLGEAEAKIHNSILEKIHFHEVGAIDSIIDLVGSIICFDYLEVQKIYTTPIPLGSGFTKTAHGNIPVPSPAALEILKGYTVQHKEANYEMTTPTGATLIKILSDGILADGMTYQLEKSGYGIGSYQSDLWPNLLRISTASVTSPSISDRLTVIETNIDDMNPELLAYVSELLLGRGANDVFITPIIMKKGRPGSLLSVLAPEDLIPMVEQILFQETTTIGIRKYQVKRSLLPRGTKTIKTSFGDIEVKYTTVNDVIHLHPEYETCREIARKYNLPLKEVYREIERISYPTNE